MVEDLALLLDLPPWKFALPLCGVYIYSTKSRLYCTVNFPGKSSVIMSFADSVSETSHGSYGCERHQLYFATPASMCLCHSLGRAKKGRPSQCHCRDLPGEYGGSPHVRRISTHRNQPASSCLVLFAGSQAYLLDIEEFVECRLRCLWYRWGRQRFRLQVVWGVVVASSFPLSELWVMNRLSLSWVPLLWMSSYRNESCYSFPFMSKFCERHKIFPQSCIKIRRKISLLAWYNSVYKNLAFTK